MKHAEVARALRARRHSEDDLQGRCLHAAVSRRLFGASSEVTIAGAAFAVHRRLGSGAMGAVYEVERPGQSGRFALKLLHRAGGEQAYRLKQEFRTLARLGHPNLVALHELFVDAESAAFTMALVRGTDLADYVRPRGVVCPARLRDVVAQLCAGLAELHAQGIVHRDLKPSNVLVSESGRAVLLDFGVALRGPERDVSGTLHYMAPEQRLGSTVPASDMFALGVMIDGVLPSDETSPPELAVLRALSSALRQTDPAQRPTAQSVQQQLAGGSPQRRGPAHRSPFVGRAHELATLLSFACAPRLTPRLIYVDGASGQGKSALIDELVCRLRAAHPDALILGGRCCRRETVRYRALDPLIDALSDALVEAKAARTEALRPLVTRHLLALFPVLERVPAFAAACKQQGAVLVDPRERRADALSSLRKLLAQLSRQRPVVMCIDDAHWLDDESLSVVRELLEGEGAPPLLWICAGRVHERDVAALLARSLTVPNDVCRHALAPLSRDDARALARTLLPERADLWERALDLSAGSPFVLSQLDQTLFARHADGAELTLACLLDDRLEALPEPARALLELVSTATQPLTAELLGQVGGVSRADVEGALSLLEVQRYVRSTAVEPVRIEPYHDRVAETVVARMGAARRTRVHRGIADALVAAPGPCPTRALWYHYRQAGARTEALAFGRRAADEAAAQLRFHEAAALYEDCCTHADDFATRTQLARAHAGALENAGRDRAAADVLRALVEAEPSTERSFDDACKAAELYLQAGYADAALSLLAPALRALDLRPHRTTVGQLLSLLTHRVRVRWAERRGATSAPVADAQAHARIEVCLLLARGLGRIAPLHGLDYASRLAFHVRRGGTEKQCARARLHEALRMVSFAPNDPRIDAAIAATRAYAERAGDPVLCARVASTAARCAMQRVDRAAVLRHAEEAVQLFEAHAHGAQMDLGEVRWLYQLARLTAGEQAAAELDEVVRDAVQRGDRYTEKNARICLAIALLARGDVARARREADAVAAACAPGFREGASITALSTQARVDLYLGAPTGALARLAHAERGLRLHGYALVPSMRTDVRYLLALAALQTGTRGAEGRARRIARSLARETIYCPPLLARQLRAGLRAHAGDVAGALGMLDVLIPELEAVGAVWCAWASALLRHELAGDAAQGAALIARLRARGTAEPRRFLSAYAPFLAPPP